MPFLVQLSSLEGRERGKAGIVLAVLLHTVHSECAAFVVSAVGFGGSGVLTFVDKLQWACSSFTLMQPLSAAVSSLNILTLCREISGHELVLLCSYTQMGWFLSIAAGRMPQLVVLDIVDCKRGLALLLQGEHSNVLRCFVSHTCQKLPNGADKSCRRLVVGNNASSVPRAAGYLCTSV